MPFHLTLQTMHKKLGSVRPWDDFVHEFDSDRECQPAGSC